MNKESRLLRDQFLVIGERREFLNNIIEVAISGKWGVKTDEDKQK